MAKPQQPELGRSRKTPAQDPNAAAGLVEAHGDGRVTGDPAGPVPPDNQPGHHPDIEQDKPDPEAFAARMGITEPQPSAGAGTGEPTAEDEPPAGAAENASSRGFPWKAVAGLAVVAGAGIGIRRRRHRSRPANRKA